MKITALYVMRSLAGGDCTFTFMKRSKTMPAGREIDWQPTDIRKVKGLFKTEKTLCNFIEDNIELFCTDVLGEELKNYKREHNLFRSMFGITKSPRVDFLIETENYRAFFEVKNGAGHTNLAASIGQILTYGSMDDKANRLFIVMSEVSLPVVGTIVKYRLPIEVVLLTNEQIGKWNLEFYESLITGEKQVEDGPIS